MMNVVEQIPPDLKLLIEREIDPQRDYVFVSGSRLEGFGNEASDIDLFIINDSFPRPPNSTTGVPTRAELWVDIELKSHKEVESIKRRINETSLDDFHAIYQITGSELVFYYRVLIGEPVINAEVLRNVQSQFKKKTLAKIYEIWTGLTCQDALAKTEFFLTTDNKEAAYFLAQEAVGHAVDSFLASHGECYVGTKWRFEKLARAFGESSSLYQKAWKLRSLGNSDNLKYVQDSIDLCLELGMGRFPKSYVGATAPKRAKNVQMVETSDFCFLVQDEIYIYYLSPYGRYLWMLIDGQNMDNELASRLSVNFSIDPENATRLTVEFVDMLRIYGLIE